MQGEPTAIEEVCDGVLRVPLETPTLPPATRTNTFVISGPAGPWVVDPGSPHRREVNRLLEVVEEVAGRDAPAKGTVAAFFITHHHPDHWGGLKRLRRAFEGPVVCRDPARIDAPGAVFRPLEWVQQALPGYRALHTPGHSADHAVLCTPGGDVLAGDLVAGVGTVVIDPPDGDMADYLDSLNQLKMLPPRRLFPAHGPTVTDGVGKLEEYIAHRTHREAQVVAAFAAMGPATAAQVVPRIYTDVRRFLYPFAARSVLAHLLKLEREGRVRRVGERFELTGA